jgi:hypothetical protein
LVGRIGSHRAINARAREGSTAERSFLMPAAVPPERADVVSAFVRERERNGRKVNGRIRTR